MIRENAITADVHQHAFPDYSCSCAGGHPHIVIYQAEMSVPSSKYFLTLNNGRFRFPAIDKVSPLILLLSE
jgi:hypothetical protein